MGRFFDEQTDDDDDDDGRTDGRRADKKHARTWGQKGSAEEDEVEWRRSNQKWKRNEWRTGGRADRHLSNNVNRSSSLKAKMTGGF